FQMAKKPYLVGGLALLFGYFWCWATRFERPVSTQLMQFHRQEQLARLRQLLSKPLSLSR
ncbi:MAG: glycosyltransferase family 2 protein, partial [Gammaproteobacteria bacterium]